MTGIFSIRRRLGQSAARFASDTRGSLSIEFAIIVPFLLFLTTSGLTYWDGYRSKSRAAKVAYTISDIMARHDIVDNLDMAYLANLYEKMTPNDVDRRSLRISVICFENDKHTVMWSYVYSGWGAQTPAALKVEDLPTQIFPVMEPQDSVVLVETKGRWRPRFINVGLSEKEWRSTLVSRPRFVKLISHANVNQANICPS